MNDIVVLNQKPLIDSFLTQGPRPLSSYSFVNIFAWSDFFDFEIKLINDCLCIFAHHGPGCFLYLPPLGRNMDSSTIDFVFEHMAKQKGARAVNRIENIPENMLSVLSKDRYNQYLKPAEYVYRKEELIALKGNAYKSKRHDRNLFLGRQGKHSFFPYEEKDFNDCMALYERWAIERAQSHPDEIYREMLRENRQVHARLLRFYKNLGIVARVLRAGDKLIGYTFGYPLDEHTFCVYAEITDLSATGAAAYIFQRFCADEELGKFTRINAMDDFAMPQVAQAKKAYHPAELIFSYSISLKKAEK